LIYVNQTTYREILPANLHVAPAADITINAEQWARSLVDPLGFKIELKSRFLKLEIPLDVTSQNLATFRKTKRLNKFGCLRRTDYSIVNSSHSRQLTPRWAPIM